MTAILSKSMAFSRYSAISFIRRPNGVRKNAIAFKPNYYMLTGKQEPTRNAKRPKGEMAETSINIIDALRGQEAQLRRLLAQKVLISEAPRSQLSEIEAQVTELKRLLNELEKVIQDRLKARP